jgi:phosphoadenosine phosphosulfate reductase
LRLRAHQGLSAAPTNPPHERGFALIGCAPGTCTIRPGEPERAGRWWWQDDARKECGLHQVATPT